MKKLNPHTFLDLPFQIGIAEAAKPELERYCREKNLTQEAAITAIAQDHLDQMGVQMRAHSDKMSNSTGAAFVGYITDYDLAVLDAMLPMIEQRRITVICTRGQSLEMASHLVGMMQVAGYSGQVVTDENPPILH